MKKLIIIFLFTTSFFTNSNLVIAQWIQTNGPYGGTVCSFAISDTNIFAGTNGGGVCLSTNNGTSWTVVNTGLTNLQVWSLAVSGTDLFAGTHLGGVCLSTNNGTSWTAVNTGLTNIDVRALAISDPYIFAGTNGGGVFRSTNNGTSWTATNLNNKNVSSLAVSGTNLFAGASWQGVFLSTNMGTSWIAVNPGFTTLGNHYNDVWSLAVSSTNLFAGAGGNGVWRRPLSEMITSVGSFSIELPSTFSLEQNYPNPFNSETTFHYQLPEKSHVRISIYNESGQLVSTLIDSNKEPGDYTVRWDSRNNRGYLSETGIYFAKFETEKFIDVKKVLLIK